MQAAPTRDLPVIGDRVFDNTALDLYMTCEWKFYAGMVLHRRHRSGDIGTSPALSYGAAFHKALEIHYKTDGDEDAVFDGVLRAWKPHGKPDDHRTMERVLVEYGNYVERYGKPSQEEAKTLGFPENPLVEIGVNAVIPSVGWSYAGKIDRIIELNGLYYVEDHKTTSQMGNYYFKQFELSNQMMGYAVIAGLLIGQPIAGVRVNAHAIYKRESKFQRQIFTYSPERLNDWAENYGHWLQRIALSYESGIWRRNFNACNGKYGMCQYVDVCSMPPRLRMQVLQEDFEHSPWNPLEAYEEDAEP